jgi:hypothetical protein
MELLRVEGNADLLRLYLRSRRSARRAEKRLAKLPERGGTKTVQLARWAAKYDLKRHKDGMDVAVGAAKLRCGVQH